MKKSMKGLRTCICALLFLNIIHSSVVQAATVDVVNVHLQLFPDNTGKAASFDDAHPSNIVVDVPIYPHAELVHVHDAPSGIGIRYGTGLHSALSEYMVPNTYPKTVAWISSVMPKYGYKLETSDVNAFEYASESNSKLHIDITLWDIGDQTLIQYWVTELVPDSNPKGNNFPLLLLVIVIAVIFSEIMSIKKSTTS